MDEDFPRKQEDRMKRSTLARAFLGLLTEDSLAGYDTLHHLLSDLMKSLAEEPSLTLDSWKPFSKKDGFTATLSGTTKGMPRSNNRQFRFRVRLFTEVIKPTTKDVLR